MSTKSRIKQASFIYLAIFPFMNVLAQNATQVTPGELVINHPTLINLGFEWHIAGDDNRNAGVAVAYRRVDDTAWQKGMPLLRLQGERIEQVNTWALQAPNMFAGSILDLEPGTAYEARIILTDPDGVTGAAADATRITTVSTRSETVPAPGGNVYHVYTPGYTGPKQEPAFDGIMCACNYRCGSGDTAPVGRPHVKPVSIPA